MSIDIELGEDLERELRDFLGNDIIENNNDDIELGEELERELRLIDELNELRIRASALGVKNTENMDKEKLEERIGVMLKVRLEGLSRLEFDDDNVIVPSLENLRILQIEAVEPKHLLNRAVVIQKLQGYRLLNNKLNTNTRRWTRYISTKDNMLRAGGFPIRNRGDEEFIVFKNVSKKFTFSVKRDDVILMEKLPSDSLELLSDTVITMISEFRDVRNNGNMFVVVNDDFDAFHIAPNKTQIARISGLNRSGLARGFTSRRIKYKNFFLFKLSQADAEELRETVDGLTEEEVLGNRGIQPNLMNIINRFYPV